MIVPIQQWGIGDIIFEMTLVKSFKDSIWWPVNKQFVEGLQRAYPDVWFMDAADSTVRASGYDDNRKEEYWLSAMRFLPLRWADVMLNLPYTMCMQAKYLMYSLDWQDWKRDAMFKRYPVKENELQAFLGIADGLPYNLVNRYFRSNNSGKADILPYNGLRNVEMRTIPGFSLFDWAGIIENATEIHTVSTSIIYILELLELKAKEIHLYKRLPDENDFKNIDYLLTSHDYILH